MSENEYLSAPESRRTLARMLADGEAVTVNDLADVLSGYRGWGPDHRTSAERYAAHAEAHNAMWELERSGEAVRVFIGRDVFTMSVESAERLPAAAAEGIAEAREAWETEPSALPADWRPGGRVSATERDEIAHLTRAGWAIDAIARKLGRSQTTVRKCRKQEAR